MIYDIILIAVILLSVIIGARHGASKTIVSLIAVFLAATLSIALSKPLADIVFENFLRSSLENKVAGAITKSITTAGAEFVNPMGKVYLSAMEYFGNYGQTLNQSIENVIVDSGKEAAAMIVDMYKPVVVGFVSVIIAIVLFIVLAFVFRYLSQPLLKIFKFSLLKRTDKLLGAVLGFARGVVAILTLAMLLKLLAPVIPADTFFFGSESVNKSTIFTYIYNGGLTLSIQSFVYNFT